MTCDYCDHEFEPTQTRWLCPACKAKHPCCDGAPLPIAGGLVALYRLLTGALNKRLDDISSQLRRNGGTSLRDAVDRIEERTQVLHTDVRDLRERLDDHITWHLEKDTK
jgi:hypothetical protein